MAEAADRTLIRIGLPLPLDVAGTLMALIGRTYPDTLIHQDGHRELVISVPTAARIAPDAVDTDDLPDSSDPDMADATLEDWGPDGLKIGLPQQLVDAFGGMAAGMFEQFPEAENYLETTFSYPDDPMRQYVVIVARAHDLTPHALRLKAEARIAELEAESAQMREALAAVQGQPHAL